MCKFHQQGLNSYPLKLISQVEGLRLLIKHLKNQSQTLNILIQSENMYTQKRKTQTTQHKDERTKTNTFKSVNINGTNSLIKRKVLNYRMTTKAELKKTKHPKKAVLITSDS